MYKFKEITTVPESDALIDIVLSRTQRKTPTVVHPGYKITRIRNFYLRKIKFCQTTFSEKFTAMLSEFPRLDDIHPFYSDLCNVMYDRDHYKLGLGQVSTVKNIIDSCAKDYVRMMKFADSLYRCKMLKRAAFGRMCTAVKKLQPTLKYLEEVRQHLGRLPTINPVAKTLLLTGYPNVGKSSFMNTVTNANVDVQAYANTTKSLYLGHMDYELGRWQVIDSPGVTDQPLEERGTIEMTAITALAHLPACILYFVDLSESCGWNLKQQVSLFNSMKPLFRNKPLIILLNKIDLKRLEDLTQVESELVLSMTRDFEVEEDEVEEVNGESGGNKSNGKSGSGKILLMPVSCATKEGIDDAKNKACQLLLKKRVDAKLNSSKIESLKNRITVVQPRNMTSNAKNNRTPTIPAAIQKQRELAEKREIAKKKGLPMPIEEDESGYEAEQDSKDNDDDDTNMGDGESDAKKNSSKNKRQTEKELQELHGGAGVYSVDFQKSYMLERDEWKYDCIPEIMDGMNVADFVDENILEKLAELEAEEREELEREGLEDTDQVLASWQETEREIANMHQAIRTQQMHQSDRKARNSVGQKVVERRSVKTVAEVASAVEKALENTDKYVSTQELRANRKEEEGDDMNDGASKKSKRSSEKRTAAELEVALRSRSKTNKKRLRDEMEEQPRTTSQAMSRKRSTSQVASAKVTGLAVSTDRRQSRVATSLGRPELQEKAEAKRRKLNKQRNQEARKGEGDRHIPDFKPKHLYSGKRGMGKTDRR